MKEELASGGSALPWVFERTPYETIREKFPRDDGVFAPNPKTIYVTDFELRAMGEMLEVMREIEAAVK